RPAARPAVRAPRPPSAQPAGEARRARRLDLVPRRLGGRGRATDPWQRVRPRLPAPARPGAPGAQRAAAPARALPRRARVTGPAHRARLLPARGRPRACSTGAPTLAPAAGVAWLRRADRRLGDRVGSPSEQEGRSTLAPIVPRVLRGVGEAGQFEVNP